jgi:hypothetical protein
MAAGSTYVPIYTTTLTTTQSDITLTSFSGYTDLVIVSSLKLTSGTNDMMMQFNGDTGSNYPNTFLRTDGTTLDCVTTTSTKIFCDSYGAPDTTNEQINIVHLNGYSNATTYKQVLCQAGRASGGVDLVAGGWSNTAAITSIRVFVGSQTLDIGSKVTVFGILAA